jgi:hypothetical protein
LSLSTFFVVTGNRLTIHSFPKIRDSELVSMLREVALRHHHYKRDDEEQLNGALPLFRSKVPTDRTPEWTIQPISDSFARVSEADARFLADHFDSHMGDVISTLQAVVQKQMPLKG